MKAVATHIKMYEMYVKLNEMKGRPVAQADLILLLHKDVGEVNTGVADIV
jgi:hypothetical protein